ncbi:MAG: tetratricopeptide repeat protein, partial [Pirellulaceae bacterium]|nr:tetratricopeptide repeat protein [Pirellulaceae bacterium]
DGLESSHLVWQAGMRAAAEFPVAGTGAGTASDVLPIYLPSARAADDRLAENAYLRVFQEAGLAGFLLLLVGLGLVIRWTGRMVRRAESRDAVALGGAIAASVVVSLLHALIEPVWGVPACMSMTVVLAGCACRLSQLVRGGSAVRTTELARPVWIAMVFVLLGLGLGMLHQMTPPALAAWDRDRFELQVARLIADEGRTAAQGAGSRDDLPAPVVAILRRHLERVLEYDRHDAAAHLQLARIRVWEFQRLARSNMAPADSAFAEAGQRRLSEARDLLREGLRICPVLGDGYGDLAELALLDGSSPELRLACLRQAVRLRPREYSLRRALAEELLAAGSADESIEHFRWCLRQRPDDAHLQRRLAQASGRMWH